MRVLLDECLPRRLKFELPGHDCRTVPEMGWASIANGELLALAAGQFDVFLTVDQNIAFQQNIPTQQLGIIALRAPSNDIDDLRPLLPRVLALVPKIRPGQILAVGG